MKVVSCEIPFDWDGAVSFRDDVNTNAYYFVDVCAERGPASVYFVSDRDSRLGSQTYFCKGRDWGASPTVWGGQDVTTP